MYGKRTARFQFLILRLMVPKIRQLQSDLVYLNYFVLSNNVGLARYPENRNQTCSHGGIRGKSSLNFFELQLLFCQENYLLKTIIKTEVETPKKCFVPTQVFRPKLQVWPKRTLKGETETNCRVRRTVNLSKYVDCMWNMTKWNSHGCFWLLADRHA